MKDIQEIVKKVADRYNAEYDPNLFGPKVRYKDETIKQLDIFELEKLFPKMIRGKRLRYGRYNLDLSEYGEYIKRKDSNLPFNIVQKILCISSSPRIFIPI